jgi:hypothetical protein
MTEEAPPASKKRTLRTLLVAGTLVLAGGAIGGGITRAFGPTVEMAPQHVVALKDVPNSSGVLTVKGRVAQLFGPRLMIEDGTGRMLVETGRGRWLAQPLAAVGDAVTVQGRYTDGSIRASFLVDGTGNVVALRGGRHEGRRHDGEHGRGKWDPAPAAVPVATPPATPATSPAPPAPSRP